MSPDEVPEVPQQVPEDVGNAEVPRTLSEPERAVRALALGCALGLWLYAVSRGRVPRR